MALEETFGAYRRSRRKRRAWAADNPGNVAIRAELLDAVLDLAAEPLRGEGKILDVGCGGGWLLERLAGRDMASGDYQPWRVDEGRLHGIDALEPRVEAARRRLPGAAIDLADARSLPHPDSELSLVTLMTCLSSLPDRAAAADALAEAKRVLAPGGLLLAYEPRLPNPLNRATQRISPRMLHDALGPPSATRRLTGFPPLARRLGPATWHLYPWLSRAAPTHGLTAWLA